jgi:hypothetical protein
MEAWNRKLDIGGNRKMGDFTIDIAWNTESGIGKRLHTRHGIGIHSLELGLGECQKDIAWPLAMNEKFKYVPRNGKCLHESKLLPKLHYVPPISPFLVNLLLSLTQ